MKVLILSCNTGGGHNIAGRALYEEFHRRGLECEFVDALSFARPKAAKKATSLYVNITTKTPAPVQFFYNLGQWILSPHLASKVYSFNRKYAKKLCAYITEQQFDLVVVPHLFPAVALAYLKKKHLLDIQTYAVATNYTYIPHWDDTNPDYMIIPHRELTREFFKGGISYEKLLPLGLPVPRTFGVRRDQLEARQALELPTEGRMVLILPGSLKRSTLRQMATSLHKEYGSRLNFVLLCAPNSKRKEKLTKAFANISNVHVIDYTDQVSLYMDASNILVTKAGGITCTEAAAKQLPMILMDPVPGCETRNADFFTRHGMALQANKKSDYLAHIRRLLDDQELYRSIQQAQETFVNPISSALICETILADQKEDNLV